jgi:hypothetical protein
MSTISTYPRRYMRGLAGGELRELGEIWRNDGYGYTKLIDTKANIRHRLNTPAPGDPTDATAAQAEFVEVHLPWNSPVRIGDRYKRKEDEKSWVIGLVNATDSYATFIRSYASRPIAATPYIIITLRRFNNTLNSWSLIPPQTMQMAWSRNQPDRLMGVAVRQYGFLFAPEGFPDLDILQGDTFFYAGLTGTVTWVPPDPGLRREAIFSMNIGEGT